MKKPHRERRLPKGVVHPEIDDRRLIENVKKTTASKIREIADKYQRGTVVGGGGAATMYYRKHTSRFTTKGSDKERL